MVMHVLLMHVSHVPYACTAYACTHDVFLRMYFLSYCVVLPAGSFTHVLCQQDLPHISFVCCIVLA